MYNSIQILDSLKEIKSGLKEIHKLLKVKERPFISIKEASKYLDIPLATLYSFTSKRTIPFFKLNDRKIYFSIEELDKFILNHNNKIKSKEEIKQKIATQSVIKKIKKGA